MFVLLHVAIALTSIIVAGLAFAQPSIRKIQASYAFVALTLATGTYLVVSTHSPLLSSCLTGLAYLAITLPLTILSHSRLITTQNTE